jgi:hypothetical protein
MFPVVIVAAEVAFLVEYVVDGELHNLGASLQAKVGGSGTWMLQGGIGIQSNLEVTNKVNFSIKKYALTQFSMIYF